MNNNDDIFRLKAELRPRRKSLCKVLEVEMEGASALMEAETLLDSKNSDYVLGFVNGFNHCLKLGERFDVINSVKDQGLI